MCVDTSNCDGNCSDCVSDRHADFIALRDKKNAEIKSLREKLSASEAHLKKCASELRGLMSHASRGDGLDWRYTNKALCEAEDYLNGK